MQPALAPAPHPSMQNSAQDHADQVLREQLIAAQQHLQPQSQESRSQPGATADQSSNIDPAISGTTMLSTTNAQPTAPMGQIPAQVIPAVQQPAPAQAPPQEQPRKTTGKRELSTSKRAAQNRAAQRAFRQRKENYIRTLEEKVKQLDALTESYKQMQNENYQLREYIISLQSRLIDSHNDVPEAPSNIDLTQPRPEPPFVSSSNANENSNNTNTANNQNTSTAGASGSAPTPVAPSQQNQPSAPPASTSAEGDLSQLNRIAVAGLGMRKHQQATNDNTSMPSKRVKTDPVGEASSDVAQGLPTIS
ncbi:hypothetical protein VTN31DRAFT_661 [Thermomyces dupontii]|uniref:uncharacterized protein n=1 Tax=Talaromyces thermophilus TaxID=28565 RepID=UPI003742A0A7